MVKTELVEFIELYNNGTNEVDLGGWSLTSGEDYTFPPGSSISARGYVVVAENPTMFNQKFGFLPYGPYSGKLDNEADRIVLRNAANQIEDEVSYQLGFPWPTVGDTNYAGGGTDLSIELIHPDLDNDLGGSWRAAVVKGFVPPSGTTLVPMAATGWRYFKGTTEASTPTTLWRQIGFDDASWLTGQAPFYYEDGSGYSGNTTLTDMRNSYSTVFMRKTFNVADPSEYGGLVLAVESDDGAIVWLNGQVVEILGVQGSEIPYNGDAEDASGEPKTSTTSIPASALAAGENVLAVQALNDSLGGSSDFWIEASLAALPVGGSSGVGPSPGMHNVVSNTNAPPQIRQVNHSPKRPQAGEVVTVTAKATDPDGVASLSLQYQVVEPGNYLELSDAAYATQWTSLPMNDDGIDGDVMAGDDVFTVILEASFQVHRRLIRYRITVADNAGLSEQVPYADDPQPNFVYFVYDGIPAWQGSVRPGVAPVQIYPAEEMSRLPAIHLISKKSEIEAATWGIGTGRYTGDEYQWNGTLIYNGEVYDHIRMRARGGVWRYAMSKNMWKFRANRGHEFEGQDNWGGKFARKWTRLNLGASIQQGDFNHRGEQGMFESVGMRMFNLAGLPAAHTAFTTLRIIDEAAEVGPDQYEGDFWGVYLVTEQMDGRFLDEHGLPDGNLYKMENGTGPGDGSLKNQDPQGVTDNSDLTSFRSLINTGTSEQWWRDNFDLERYYSYYAVVLGIHHYDICCGKNYYYYFPPNNGKIAVLPWDLDLTWADNMYQAGDGGTDRIYDDGQIFSKPGIRLQLANRIREFLDLLYNEDEAWRLLDEYAYLLQGPATGPTILDADRAMWDYNPKMVNGTYTSDPSNKAGHGRFYQAGTPTKDFAGMVQLMKNYVTYRRTATTYQSGTPLAVWAADAQIPSTPTITYSGPEDYPINRLTFRSSTFSGSGQFARMQWRIGEITDPSRPDFDPQEKQKYEIDAVWEATNTTFVADQLIPPTVVRVGRAYRARVRMIDNTGRASHWSAPHQFTAGQPQNSADLLNYLRITEIMYNPPAGGAEYVELKNISASAILDLGGVRFSQGFEYTFEAGVTLLPGACIVVADTPEVTAFRDFYSVPPSVQVVGPFASGSLNNGGEQLTLRTAIGGKVIVSFDYDDSRGWPVAADGAGHSLVLIDGAEDLQRSTSGDSGTGEFSGNWRASTYLRGSAGQADPPLVEALVLNEIAAHTDYADAEHPEYDSNDWIELYNRTGNDITLGLGWYLSDDNDLLTKWQIPADTIIPAYSWLSFDEVTGFHAPITTGFGLNKAGEQVLLSYLPGNAEDRVVDAVAFKGQLNQWTLGRYPDGGPNWYALTPPTQNAANAAPLGQLAISEIMYHPMPIGGTNDNTLDEFVEIHNPTGQAVALFNTNGAWRLDGLGIDGNFVLPLDVTLQPGDYLLITAFDPSDAGLLMAFREEYGLTGSNILFLGPFSGKLPNNSGRVALEAPQAPDAMGEGVSWVIVDEVIYSDLPPWPCDTDGTGNSLHRVGMLDYGNDPANWTGQAPTPNAARPDEPPGLPDIITQPSDRIVATNSTAQFSVGVCGTPPFTYQWQRDGVNLAGETNASLLLQGVTLSDAGQYRVIVSNAAGSAASAPAALVVQLPPTVTVQPQPVTVVRDQQAIFSVEADGTEPLSYQWLFEGAPIFQSWATNRILVLTAVQASQGGNYSVNVFNSAGGQISDNALLTVQIPATVITQPEGTVTNAGVTVTLTVEAIGTGALHYQWFFNELEIPGATSPNLEIANLQLEHSGFYLVRVTDDIGPTTSIPVEVVAKVPPSVISGPNPTTNYVALGGTAVFTLVSDGSLPMGYWWRSNNVTKPELAYTVYSYTNQLVLPNVSSEMNGSLWSVGLSNIGGRRVTPRATLVVLEPPVVTLQPTNQSVFPDEMVTFHADAAGAPELHYQWYFNVTNLVDGATNTSLTLTNVQVADFGDYTFMVTNLVGTAASEVARLTVKVAPIILAQPESQTINAGQDAILRVSAMGAEPLHYQWNQNGHNLENATNATLWILGAQPADSGDYQVTVWNELGSEPSALAILTVVTADFDEDGIPAEWEYAYGLNDENPNDANFDLDSDGMTSWEEYLAGTIPTNSLSYLSIGLEVDPAATEVRVQFHAVAERSYTVLYRDTVTSGPWIPFVDVLEATSDRDVEVTNSIPPGVSSRIYRLVVPKLTP